MLLFAIASVAPSVASPPLERAETEIYLDMPNADANLRDGWFTDVSVSRGPRRRVQIDTGSVGLVISASAIPPGVPASGTGAIHYSSSGKLLTGNIYRAVVAFAGRDDVRTVAIPVLGVTRIVCERPGHGACRIVPGEASRVGMLGIGFGRHGSGADLSDVVHEPESAVNPFLQIAAMVSGYVRRAYTIEPTRIVLGMPHERGTSPWKYFDLSHDHAGDWNALSGCFSVAAYATRCAGGSVLVDTGVGVVIASVPDRKSGYITRGTPMTIDIAGAPGLSFAFISSGERCSGSTLSCARWSHRSSYPVAVNSSRHLIAAADYRFDDVRGRVGFRERTTHRAP